MDELFRQFGLGQAEGSGPILAETLSPEPPDNDLRGIMDIGQRVQGPNVAEIKSMIRRKLKENSPPMGLANDEIQGWVEVYYAYGKALNAIVFAKAQDSTGRMLRAGNGSVRLRRLLQINPMGCWTMSRLVSLYPKIQARRWVSSILPT